MGKPLIDMRLRDSREIPMGASPDGQIGRGGIFCRIRGERFSASSGGTRCAPYPPIASPSARASEPAPPSRPEA
jgi:hypothetical protein